MREVRRSRRVRLGDVAASGRLRLDALARYLQDVAWDDVADAGMTDGRWVVRRVELRLAQMPRFGDEVDVATSCTGYGSRWAQRRTLVVGRRAEVESTAIWVHLDDAGRPQTLDPRFASIWGDELPRVSARLLLPSPPKDAARRRWQLRASDVDVLGHLNNASALAAVEDELARTLPGRRVIAGEFEYRDAIDPGDDTVVAHQLGPDELRVWLLVDDVSRFAARVSVGPSVS